MELQLQELERLIEEVYFSSGIFKAENSGIFKTESLSTAIGPNTQHPSHISP